MKVLVVGGSGLIGGEIALYLEENGHDVTLMARKAPQAEPLKHFAWMKGDYINDEISTEALAAFDWLVFSAAADIRNVPQDGSVTPEAFYQQANDIAVPHFVANAKAAGVKKVVYVGTFYPQVAPQQIGECPYVTSRHNTCEGLMALSDDNFEVFALNAPFVLGHIDGIAAPHLTALVDYAKGKLEGMPVFAPQGGTNHMTSRSIAEASLNAFTQGTPGTAYLIGDENFTWKEYLELWFKAAGNPQDIPLLEEEHPMFPYIIQFAGPNAVVSYEPDERASQDLAYSRNRMESMIKTVIAANSND